MTTISNLYNVESSIRSFTSAEKEIFYGLFDSKYDFKNNTLQKEIGIEKLKTLFFQFIKKDVTLSDQDSRIVGKYLKMAKTTKTQLPILLSEEYQNLKHLVDNKNNSLSIIMLKILFLIENEKITIEGILSQIEFVKSISNMDTELSDVQEIMNMVVGVRKIKLPVRRGGKKQRKVKETLEKKLTTRTKNKIYNQILKKKLEIFKDVELEEKTENDGNKFFDEQLMRILSKQHKDDKRHVYIYKKRNEIENLTEYFDFIFELKSKTNKLDNILQSSINCLFDEYHTHINWMLEEQDEPFTFPFQYEQNDTVYIVQSNFISHLTNLRNYKYIHEIANYFIDYLINNEYLQKFIDHETPFYFAQLKGFLRLIGYTDNKQNQLYTVFKQNSNQEKRQKRSDKKIKFIQNKGFDKLIDIDINEISSIPIGNKNDKGENLENYLEIKVSMDKLKLSFFLKSRFPKTWERKHRVLKRKEVLTFKQFEESVFFEKYKLSPVEEEEKKEDKKPEPFNFIDIDFDDFNDYLPMKEEEVEESFDDNLKRMQVKLELIQFKMQYGLSTLDQGVLKNKYEKMLYQLDENNRNNILITNVESDIKMMERLFDKTSENEKSKVKRQILKLKMQKHEYQTNIKDVDKHGFAYGVNFEEQKYSSGGYVTTEVINATKKMQETMKIVDSMFKKKKVNLRLNMFVINLLNNFEYVHSQLYDLFSLFVNHKMDVIFEKYLMKHKTVVKTDLLNINNDKKKQKELGNDFSRLMMIIFFILENEKDSNKFYTLITKQNKYVYQDKFVDYNGELGKVLEQKDDVLYIKFFEGSIEKIDKNLVKIVDNLERRNVKIKKGPYKGWICSVYKQIGDELQMTLDTFGLNNVTDCKTNVRRLKMSIDDVIIQRSNITNTQSTVYVPKDPDNKDLYSMARFLFQQITENSNNQNKNNNMMYFNDLYKTTLKHVNEIIYLNEGRNRELKELKRNKDKTFKKIKKIYESDGLINIDLSDVSFRTDERDDICLIKDNSKNYQNEEEDISRFNDIKPTPKEQKAIDDLQQENFLNKYKSIMENFSEKVQGIDFLQC